MLERCPHCQRPVQTFTDERHQRQYRCWDHGEVYETDMVQPMPRRRTVVEPRLRGRPQDEPMVPVNGERLAAMLRDRGWSANTLRTEARVGSRSVRRALDGVRIYRPTVAAMAAALGVSVEEITA